MITLSAKQSFRIDYRKDLILVIQMILKTRIAKFLMTGVKDFS
jgi:hypothetical protein